MIVDVHAHHVPQKMLDALVSGRDRFDGVEILHQDGVYKLAFNGGSPTRPIMPKLRDNESRQSWLEENGIDMQVSGGWLDAFGYELPSDTGAAWSRFLSEHLLESCASTEFMVPLASVPMQDGVRAAELLSEFIAAGHKGVMIGTQPKGKSGNLDDPSLDPFWAAASALNAVVFIHPMFGCGDPRLEDYGLINGVGRGLDTTTAVARLLFAGHFLKYPGMKVVLSHGGGALAFMLGRLIRNAAIHEGMSNPRSGFEKLYFDSVVFEPSALAFLVEQAGADRVMLGSDYPFPIGDPRPRWVAERAGFDDAELVAMLGGTAERLFELDDHDH